MTALNALLLCRADPDVRVGTDHPDMVERLSSNPVDTNSRATKL
jgi:hypothetical protein